MEKTSDKCSAYADATCHMQKNRLCLMKASVPSEVRLTWFEAVAIFLK